MKCKNCGIELAQGRNRILSKAKNGLCGDCVNQSADVKK